MKNKGNILLVEDDKNLGFIIKDFLHESGYHVDLAENGQSALAIFGTKSFDLVLLDVMLPIIDGFSVAETIKAKNAIVPIIFLTARSLDDDKIRGLKIGADDYITKPFSTEELLLRVEAVLRRTKGHVANVVVSQEIFQIGSYTFDSSNQTITLGDDVKMLTRKEADLLRLLCINKNQLVRRDFALKLIWGEDDYFMGRSMDVYITKLRKILKDDPSIQIQNVHRTGFKLEVKD
ncbi:MAG TPA: response regulator transcription factor [Bacteroidales bacterium]|nr:response regulator transcription factor [Bacteroidales bacterium]